MSSVQVKGKSFEVSDDVRYAVDVMVNAYGGEQSFATGHAEGPRVVYDFAGHGGAQVALRLNKGAASMYLRDATRDGRFLSKLFPGHVEKVYTGGKERPYGFIADGKAPYLKPGPANHLLRLKLERHELAEVLNAYLRLKSDLPTVDAAVTPIPPVVVAIASVEPNMVPASSPIRLAIPMAAEDFQAQLDRNAETGRAGEIVAMKHEVERLRQAGCSAPEEFVARVALTDVGRGYDIASTWPGEERCIEVKSTTRLGTDIYLSENERSVLEALGKKAWLYRVLVTPECSRVVGDPLQDPVRALTEAGMTPAVWRAPDPSAKAAQEHR